MSNDMQEPTLQPGTTLSSPTPLRPHRSRKVVFIISAAILIVGILSIGFVSIQQRGVFPIPWQSHGPVYYVTPQGGPPPAMTPQINPGGPMILSNPMPAFFLAGEVFRNATAYRADTGAPIQQYLKSLGNVSIYQPQFARGVLYMAVRLLSFHDDMAMYAVRASDGTILWKWDTCGDRVNMQAPLILGNAVYFVCQTSPLHYDLLALHADTGKLIWRDSFSGEIDLNLCAYRQTLYVQLGNQIIAEDAANGQQIWQQSFGFSDYPVSWMGLNQGILYIVRHQTFFALHASNGEHLWEYDFDGDYGGLEAIAAPNTLYLFARQFSGPTTIYALNGESGALRWQKRLSDSDYGTPVADQGNLYLVVNVFPQPRTNYASPIKRTLLAIRGSDGQTFWQQDIPWNKGQLNYATIEPPMVSVGGGRVYLVDWQPSSNFSDLRATLGAFSENNGALLWTRGNFAQN